MRLRFHIVQWRCKVHLAIGLDNGDRFLRLDLDDADVILSAIVVNSDFVADGEARVISQIPLKPLVIHHVYVRMGYATETVRSMYTIRIHTFLSATIHTHTHIYIYIYSRNSVFVRFRLRDVEQRG